MQQGHISGTGGLQYIFQNEYITERFPTRYPRKNIMEGGTETYELRPLQRVPDGPRGRYACHLIGASLGRASVPHNSFPRKGVLYGNSLPRPYRRVQR